MSQNSSPVSPILPTIADAGSGDVADGGRSGDEVEEVTIYKDSNQCPIPSCPFQNSIHNNLIYVNL